MKRTREQAGRLAKFVGDLFESWFDGQNARAKQFGMLAHIHHNEPKTIYIKGKLKHAKKSVADYSGTLEGGRSLAAETKSWSGENFPRSQVDTLQAQHLETTARAGGLALLVVEFREPYIRRFAVPWLEVPWQVLRSAQTVTAGALERAGWAIPTGDDTCYLTKFHSGGPPSTPVIRSKYARE